MNKFNCVQLYAVYIKTELTLRSQEQIGNGEQPGAFLHILITNTNYTIHD